MRNITLIAKDLHAKGKTFSFVRTIEIGREDYAEFYDSVQGFFDNLIREEEYSQLETLGLIDDLEYEAENGEKYYHDNSLRELFPGDYFVQGVEYDSETDTYEIQWAT